MASGPAWFTLHVIALIALDVAIYSSGKNVLIIFFNLNGLTFSGFSLIFVSF